MRFQVPQFTDIEDKIIGPFTLKQFIMYIVAGMLLVPVYIYSDLSLFITIALPVIGIAAVFAHVKIYGKSFGAVVLAGFSYVSKGQLYIWRRQKVEPFKIVDDEWDAVRTTAKAERGSSSLDAIAQSLDTKGNVSTEDIEDPLAEEPK